MKPQARARTRLKAGERRGISWASSRAEQPRITYVVGRLERAVRRELGRVTRRFGLTVAQYTALSVVKARGELSNAQLARRTFVSPQAMNEIVQEMARKALLAREPHEHHGRIVVMRLTAKGKRVLAQCDREVATVEQAMLELLSQAKRNDLRELLRSCAETLEGRGTSRRRRGA